MPTFTSLSPMLRTDDIRKTIDFYTVNLGFRLDSAWPEDKPCWCSLIHDSVNIMFFTHDPHDSSALKMTGRLYIRTDDAIGLFERIKNRVKVVEQPKVQFYGMHEFAIEDNNGYVLAIGQPTDAPPTCKEH